MAYNIGSASLSQDPQLFCNSLHPAHFLQLSPKPSTLSFRIRRAPSLQISQVYVQEPIQTSKRTSNSQHPDEKTKSSSKINVWINPNSPRASKLRQISNDFKYSSLVRISQSLDSCSANEGEVSRVLAALGDKAVEQDAVVILNNMSNPETALLALNYFLRTMKLKKEVILYNVTLKVLKKNKDLSRAEKLFDEMLERGVKPDNITFSTIISCARLSSLPEKGVEWFDKMPEFGCKPDIVTYSAMIDCYGRSGNVDKALSLYDRARAEKWRIDVVTFSTLMRIYGASGNFDGCLNVYEEMKALGTKPNLLVYNNLLDAMGRARRPWQAKNIYLEMVQNGFQPNWSTYAALIQAYGKARYGEDCINVYREMKEKGMELNTVLYNTLLATCADLGVTDEAIEIYKDMKSSELCKPDHWTYSSLIKIYSCSGKVLEAEAVLDEMAEVGLEPDIFVLTSLVQCYGKANRLDDVVRTFDRLAGLGLSPDERFCSCLLNVLVQIPKEEMYKLSDCIDKANPKLGYIVKLLKDEENAEGEVLKREAVELFNSIGTVFRKAYCSSLIDICVNLNQIEKACELLDLGIALDIYTDIQSKEPTRWSLHLKSLSFGTALTAFHVWMNDLNETIENGEELPPVLGINTGHVKHKYSKKGLKGVFESHLKELNAPFHEAPHLPGWFLTTNIAAMLWLKSRHSEQVVAAKELVLNQS